MGVMMAEPVPATAAQFGALLADPDTGCAGFADLLSVDPARSQPMRPHLVLRPEIELGDDALTQLAGDIGGLIRVGRQRRYAARIAAGWQGPRLVVDGDSWFQFPLVHDLYQQLNPDHAVHCLTGGGNPLHNPIRRQEIRDAIVELRPDAVIISAGGGEVLNGARFAAFVERFAPRRAPVDYLTPYFAAFLHRELIPGIVDLVIACRAVDADVPILLHSYAYALPRDFIWLGDPLHRLGIDDARLRRQIIAAMIDKFHAALVHRLAVSGLRHVHLVDCRDAVGCDWFDELHPNNQGFANIARRFRQALASLL